MSKGLDKYKHNKHNKHNKQYYDKHINIMHIICILIHIKFKLIHIKILL